MSGTLFFNHVIGKGLGWAVSNVMLAFPFFYLGYYIKCKSLFKILERRNARMFNFAIAIISLFILVYLSNINNAAYMYLGWYGNYILLFFMNGILGIYLIFMLSMALDKLKIKAVTMIAMGTIIMLGFHEHLLP